MFYNKENNKYIGTSSIWQLLDRKDKKALLNRYIKSIDIALGDNYSIVINNIVFHNELIKSGINNLTDIALDCMRNSNLELVINKPISELNIDNEVLLSVVEELNKNKEKFYKLWTNIIKSKNILYPIYDLNNVIKDIKIKVISV